MPEWHSFSHLRAMSQSVPLAKASAGDAKYGVCAGRYGVHGLSVKIPTEDYGEVTGRIYIGNLKKSGIGKDARHLTINDLILGNVYEGHDEATGSTNFFFGLREPGDYAIAIETDALDVRGGKL